MSSESNTGFIKGVFAALGAIAALVAIYEFVLKPSSLPSPVATRPVASEPVERASSPAPVEPKTTVIVVTATPQPQAPSQPTATLVPPTTTDFSKSSYVEIWLGSVNQENGLRLGPSLDDGQHQAVTVNGIPARQTVAMNVNAENAYLYFHVDDGFYFDSTGNIKISAEYLDEGFEPIFLDYDAAPRGDPHKPIFLVSRSNSQGWRNAQIIISDARFGNHQNYNADFRLSTKRTPLTVRYVRVDKVQ